jgi:hypothetical protein
MREEMEAEVEKVRRSFRAEIVPYRSSTDLVPIRDAAPGRHRIRVEPTRRRADGQSPPRNGADDGGRPRP